MGRNRHVRLMDCDFHRQLEGEGVAPSFLMQPLLQGYTKWRGTRIDTNMLCVCVCVCVYVRACGGNSVTYNLIIIEPIN